MTKSELTLNYVLERLCSRLCDEGTSLVSESVQHGLRLKLTTEGSRAEGTLYYSLKKRRFSYVPIPNGDSGLAQNLAEAVAEITSCALPGQNAAGKNASMNEIGGEESRLACWGGTDEAGKGDLFGPLVAAGFVADREIIAELSRSGLRDSKDLSTSAIQRIAVQLTEEYPTRVAVVEIGPQRYNEMYPDFKSKGGINGLLGWAHARVIRDLAAGTFSMEAVVVDRFAGEHRIRPYLAEAKSTRLIMRPRAESNPAVAAASVLARARFDQALDRMENPLGFRPHAGSGKPAVDDLERLGKADDSGRLNEFVKMHFAPVRQLRL